MSAARNETPASSLQSSEVLFAAALLVALVLVSAADSIGALLSGTRLLPLGTALRFVVGVCGHPMHVSAAWPVSHRPFGSVAFFVVLAGVVLGPTVLIAACVVVVRRHQRDGRDGFATRAEIRGTLGVPAARRLARTTRPSIDARRAALCELGYPLGRSVGARSTTIVCSWEHSLELVAPPGAGKTLRALAPILRQHPGPVLATSTKSDLAEVALAARRRIGPTVALDPEHLSPAAEPLRWSPIVGCVDAAVADRRAGAFVSASGDASDMRSGGFFRRSATAVLASYLHAAALDGARMRDVVAWATRPKDPAPLRILAEHGESTVDWAARLQTHISGAEETTSGVMRTVDLALACFSDPQVLALTSVDEGRAFGFAPFFAECGTVFALGKDRAGGVGPLITAFCDELLLQGEQAASARTGRRLDPPLLCCLDEAPSIVPLPGLPALVADGRGRGIVVIVAMQSFSQAEERWGVAGARTIRNASSILMVFGGLSVASDLEELSRLTGTRQVERSSHSVDGSGRGGVTRHLAEEPVLSPAEIHRLPDGRALVLAGRMRPVLAHLPGIWEGRDAQAIAEEERGARKENDEMRNDQ